MRYWSHWVYVREVVVQEQLHNWEWEDGFCREHMVLRKGSKSLGSVRWRARCRCPRSSWGVESTPLNSFRMAVGRSSSPAGPIKRTWDI